MKALKYKKGSIILYSLLLVLAVAVMYSLKNCNDKYYSVQKMFLLHKKGDVKKVQTAKRR